MRPAALGAVRGSRSRSSAHSSDRNRACARRSVNVGAPSLAGPEMTPGARRLVRPARRARGRREAPDESAQYRTNQTHDVAPRAKEPPPKSGSVRGRGTARGARGGGGADRASLNSLLRAPKQILTVAPEAAHSRTLRVVPSPISAEIGGGSTFLLVLHRIRLPERLIALAQVDLARRQRLLAPADQHRLRLCRRFERIPDQDHHVGVLAGLQRALAVGHAERARELMVTASSAACHFMPCATALPAS